MAEDQAWHHRSVRKDEGAATTSAELRAHNLARLLRAAHDGGRQLIEELSSPAGGPAGLKVPRARGRPTGVPSAHPQGPVVLAIDLRDDSFSLASFELTGRGTIEDRQERDARSGADLLTALAERLAVRRAALG